MGAAINDVTKGSINLFQVKFRVKCRRFARILWSSRAISWTKMIIEKVTGVSCTRLSLYLDLFACLSSASLEFMTGLLEKYYEIGHGAISSWTRCWLDIAPVKAFYRSRHRNSSYTWMPIPSNSLKVLLTMTNLVIFSNSPIIETWVKLSSSTQIDLDIGSTWYNWLLWPSL